MPIPQPHADESESDFVARCMGDETMNADYSDQGQRAAVCYRTFKDKDKAKSGDECDPESEDFDPEECDEFDEAAKAAGLGTKHRIYGRIEKVVPRDDGTIEVHGIASTEAQDDQGEVVRCTAMAAAIPDYLKFPAIREMHGPSAAGKALEIGVNPTDRTTRIVAHVVDPVAVVKVKHQVYNGFSIGGRVTERDPTDRNIITGLKLHEVSLVDRPANPEAIFDCWKLGGKTMPDGGLGTIGDLVGDALTSAMAKQAPPQLWWCGDPEHKHTKKDDAQKCMALAAHAKAGGQAKPAEPGPDEVRIDDPENPGTAIIVKMDDPRAVAASTGADPVKLALERATKAAQEAARQLLAKSGDKEDKPDDKEKDPKDEGNGDGKTDAGKQGDEAGSNMDTSTSTTMAEKDKDKPFPGAAKPFGADDKDDKVLLMIKALTDAGRMASIIMELKWLQTQLAQEAAAEGDESPMPAKIGDIVASLCDALTALVAEETAEVMEGKEMPHGMPMSAGYGPVFYASHITDLAKLLPAIEPPKGAEPITIARCVIAKANAAKLATFADELSKGLPAMLTNSQAAEPLALIKSLKLILDQPDKLAAEIYWQYADIHDGLVLAAESAGITVAPELKECAGKKPAAADQELMNMAYYAAHKASELTDSEPKKKHLEAFKASLVSIGAAKIPEQAPQEGTNPPSGTAGGNATQDTRDNASTGAPQGTTDPPSGTAGGNATQDTRDNAHTMAPQVMAMMVAIDGLAKRGPSAAQVLTDMAHDCVGKLTDDTFCQLDRGGDSEEGKPRGDEAEPSPQRFGKKSVRFSAKTIKTLGEAHGHITGAGAKCNAADIPERTGAEPGEERGNAAEHPPRLGKLGGDGEQSAILKKLNEQTELLTAFGQENRGLKDEIRKLRETPIPAQASRLPEGLVIVDKTVETRLDKGAGGGDGAGARIEGDEFVGSGPNGEITQDDVTKFLAKLPDDVRALATIRAALQLPRKLQPSGA